MAIDLRSNSKRFAVSVHYAKLRDFALLHWHQYKEVQYALQWKMCRVCITGYHIARLHIMGQRLRSGCHG